MFRRREDGTEELISDSTETAAAATTPATATAPSQPSMPSTPMPSMAPAANQPQPFRPAPPQAAMSSRTPATPVTPATPATPSPAAEARQPVPAVRGSAKRVLTVGPDIQMKGEITTCDRVVIEGMVDATMRDVHTVELTETGALKGTAEVENAEISGSFEGDLVVRGKLTISASGRVRGNVTYGEIEIQRGGQISGNVRNVADAKGATGHKKAA